MSNAVRIGFQFMVASCLLLSSSAGFASSPQTHDGFLLRLSAGPGYASSEIDIGSATYKYSGSGADLNLAIGAIVSDNLAIHATLGGWSIVEPDVELSAGNLSLDGQLDDATFGLSTFGVGVTSYFAENFYFSGSLGFAVISIDDGSERGQTDEGLGVDLTLGKEWWVSDGWGLGLAGGLGLHSVPTENTDESFQGGSLTVRFSATYN
jgi:hypothetical protein